MTGQASLRLPAGPTPHLAGPALSARGRAPLPCGLRVHRTALLSCSAAGPTNPQAHRPHQPPGPGYSPDAGCWRLQHPLMHEARGSATRCAAQGVVDPTVNSSCVYDMQAGSHLFNVTSSEGCTVEEPAGKRMPPGSALLPLGTVSLPLGTIGVMDFRLNFTCSSLFELRNPVDNVSFLPNNCSQVLALPGTVCEADPSRWANSPILPQLQLSVSPSSPAANCSFSVSWSTELISSARFPSATIMHWGKALDDARMGQALTEDMSSTILFLGMTEWLVWLGLLIGMLTVVVVRYCLRHPPPFFLYLVCSSLLMFFANLVLLSVFSYRYFSAEIPDQSMVLRACIGGTGVIVGVVLFAVGLIKSRSINAFVARAGSDNLEDPEAEGYDTETHRLLGHKPKSAPHEHPRRKKAIGFMKLLVTVTVPLTQIPLNFLFWGAVQTMRRDGAQSLQELDFALSVICYAGCLLGPLKSFCAVVVSTAALLLTLYEILWALH
eukprot:gene1007-2613_t